MMRGIMNNKIKLLSSELIGMAGLVEKQIYDSMTTLKDQDLDLAKEVMEDDDKVDDLQEEIEEKCVEFMTTGSPVAGNLRSIYTTSKIVTNLERTADYAVDICKIVPRVKGVNFSNEITPIWQIVDIIMSMIELAIGACAKEDKKATHEICGMDDRVDEIYQGMFEIVSKKMGKDESMVDQGTQILFASKYLEGIGDHVTNICEWIIFSEKDNYINLNE